jgi:hypothetical protein
MTKVKTCKCRAGSKPGKPAKCEYPTKHKSGYCKNCRDQCWSLQRHNLDHSSGK